MTEAGFGNECNFVDKVQVGLDRVSPSHIENAFDRLMPISEGYMGTSDGGKSKGFSAMQAPFVRVLSLFGALLVCWCALVDCGLFSNSEIASGVANVHMCTVQSTQTQRRRLQ